jgi:hypothetical protein
MPDQFDTRRLDRVLAFKDNATPTVLIRTARHALTYDWKWSVSGQAAQHGRSDALEKDLAAPTTIFEG